VPYALLDREGCLKMEPALGKVREKIAGGLHFPDDETGDCFKFTQALARLAGQRGVDFRYQTMIHDLITEGDRVVRLETDKGSLMGDAYVVAMGSYSPLLLRSLRIRLPVYPLKGYSVTVPIVDENAAPQSTLIDDYYKVAITRLGNRIRAAGTAEFAGYDLDITPSSRAIMGHVLQALFPAGGDLGKAEYWTGLRPSTPDGPPVLGSTGYRNLFLNTGHGTLGWTMACGSGRVVTDILGGRAPEIDISGLTLDRF
jgi:D-amino-acid dehydrogenase